MLKEAFAWGPDSPFARYLQALRDGQGWFWAVLVGALFVLLVERFVRLRGRPRSIAMYGIAASWRRGPSTEATELAWLSDDAYISFRYARNWVGGAGACLQPRRTGRGVHQFSLDHADRAGAPIGAGGGALVDVSLLRQPGRRHWPHDPTARRMRLARWARSAGVAGGVLLATNYTFASYGTSGLETMAATFLVLLAAERADAGAFVAAGVAAIAATMMHPDHALFYATLGAAIALSGKNRWQNLVRYAVPFVFIFIPYYLVRWRYYGDFFPNTYYSKSGGAAYYSQGQIYLWVSALAAGAVVVLPFSIWGTFLYRRHIVARFAMLAVPAYLAYVAKIGGDFMLGRLLCAILPYVFLMAELAVRRSCIRPRNWGGPSLGLGVWR